MISMDDKVRKNLLDLNYNKYLQYFNTCIILLFTYFIGLVIALFSKQINYENLWHLVLVFIFSLTFLGSILLLMKKFRLHLIKITKEIENLRF